MTTAAIVCEYNPFHNGHQKQFDLTRAALGADTALVCLMSGNFVQRGEPALFDKLTRARAAVRGGADLVLELPVTVCLRSAEGFGAGAVSILQGLGCVDTLSFGCESGDADAIRTVARVLLSEEFPPLLRLQLDKGLSFAAAREAAVQELAGLGALLRAPNNILAVEYCKALLRSGSPIAPLAIARGGDYHESTDQQNPSATSIRSALLSGSPWQTLVPDAESYTGAAVHAVSYGERAVLARLRAMTDAEWQSVPHGSEGLWSKVMKAARTAPSTDAILAASASKRYPRTRLQRLLACAYLGISEPMLLAPAPYVRVLAFNDRGRAVLRRARDGGSIPIISAGEEGPDRAYYALECRAADLYSLFSEAAPESGTERTLRVYYQGN